MRRILVTSALPYANGPIHLGHLVEYLQTDIWVRFQKLRRQPLRLCLCRRHARHGHHDPRPAGGDRRGRLIARMQQAHLADFSGFHIEFDNYGSTQQPGEPRLLRGDLDGPAARRAGQRTGGDAALRPGGRHVPGRPLRQGNCPKCKAPDQYGDSCDKCGAHYTPTDLIDPVSTLSGAKPEIRTAEHLFVNIEQLHALP